jgi:hypothetical protein
MFFRNNFRGFDIRELNFDGFKPGGLHEKHAIATWEPSQHLLEARGEPMKPASSEEVT